MTASEADYSRLLPIRDAVFPTFDADQKSAADAIVTALAPMLEGQRPEALIELGCGTAEILASVRDRLESGGLGPSTAIGVDCCAAEIALAKKSRIGCDFVEQRAESFMRSAARGDLRISPAQSVVMCVGHTTPHFRETEAFLDDLAKWHPALVLMDFHDGWDALVARFDRSDAEPLRQIKRRHDSPNGGVVIYALTTKSDPVEPDRVLRGIEAFSEKCSISVPFWTNQYRRSSDWYLTEMRRRGYALARRMAYQSGYGPMTAFLMSRVR